MNTRASNNMISNRLQKVKRTFVSIVVSIVIGFHGLANAAEVMLQTIDFASLSGDRVEMRLGFDGPPPEPRSYTIDNPARITLDLFGVGSALERVE